MWTKFMKGSFLLGMLLLAVRSFAATELTLEELRQEVLDSNLDVRIQYEKYHQAQRNVGVAWGQFLPSANINLININATLAVLQSVVPTPSEWFVYQGSKDLALAEKFTTESIKLNILEGLTIHFVNLKHQESLLASMKKQEHFLVGVHKDLMHKETLGVATPADVFTAKRNLLQHRQDIFALENLMAAEKQALLIALNRTPDQELELGDLPQENTEIIPENADEGIEMALKNSTELMSNKYQYHAAQFMVSSKRWSFISFNGIGFDYSSNVAIERSRARVIELQREKISMKIKNQVYSAYDDLEVLAARIQLQEEVVASNEDMDARNTELYENHLISLSKYLETKAALAAEERTLVRLQMQRLVKLAQLKRLLGLDASLSQVDMDRYHEVLELQTEEYRHRRGTDVRMEIDAPQAELLDIVSVTYSMEDVFKRSSEDASRNFAFTFRMRVPGEYELVARIMLASGVEVVKTKTIVIE